MEAVLSPDAKGDDDHDPEAAGARPHHHKVWDNPHVVESVMDLIPTCEGKSSLLTALMSTRTPTPIVDATAATATSATTATTAITVATGPADPDPELRRIFQRSAGRIDPNQAIVMFTPPDPPTATYKADRDLLQLCARSGIHLDFMTPPVQRKNGGGGQAWVCSGCGFDNSINLGTCLSCREPPCGKMEWKVSSTN